MTLIRRTLVTGVLIRKRRLGRETDIYRGKVM